MDETFFTGGDHHAVNSKDEDGNIHAGPYTVKEKYGPNSYKRRRDAARKFLITGIKNKGKHGLILILVLGSIWTCLFILKTLLYCVSAHC